ARRGPHPLHGGGGPLRRVYEGLGGPGRPRVQEARRRSVLEIGSQLQRDPAEHPPQRALGLSRAHDARLRRGGRTAHTDRHGGARGGGGAQPPRPRSRKRTPAGERSTRRGGGKNPPPPRAITPRTFAPRLDSNRNVTDLWWRRRGSWAPTPSSAICSSFPPWCSCSPSSPIRSATRSTSA